MPPNNGDHPSGRPSLQDTPPRRLVRLYGRLMMAAVTLFLVGLTLFAVRVYREERRSALEVLQGQFDERVQRVAAATQQIEQYVRQFADQVKDSLGSEGRLIQPDDPWGRMQVSSAGAGYEFPGSHWSGAAGDDGNLIATRASSEWEPDERRLAEVALSLQSFQRAVHRDLDHVVLSYLFASSKDMLGIYPYVPAIEFLRSASEPDLSSALAYAWEPYQGRGQLEAKEPEPFWTLPYEDRAGHGMMVSRVEPVEWDGHLRGLVGADVTLELLEEFVDPLVGPFGVLALLVNADRALVGVENTGLTEEDIEGLRELADPVLNRAPGVSTPAMILKNRSFWVLVEGVPGVPWTMVYVMRHGDLSSFLREERFALYVMVGGVSLFLLIGFMLVDRSFIRPALQSEERLLDSLQKEAELAALRSQINPHFLFNSLNTVRALARKQPDLARTAITRLSQILRVGLEIGKHPVIALEAELEVIRNYVALEQIRFDDRLDVDFEVAPDLEQASVPPMLLQTLMENAVKHGLEAQGADGKINARVFSEGGSLVVSITNPGRIQTRPGTTRVGLRNSRERLALLFGDQASLTLEEVSGNRVRMEARFPLVFIEPR